MPELAKQLEFPTAVIPGKSENIENPESGAEAQNSDIGEIAENESNDSSEGRRELIAAEKWSQSEIPRDPHQRCYVCGCKPDEELERLVEQNTLGISAREILETNPLHKRATLLIDMALPEVKNYRRHVQYLTRTLVKETNLVLPVADLDRHSSEARRYLGEGNWSICLDCVKEDLWSEKEESEVGPEFDNDLESDDGWGEDPEEHEVWDDDPQMIDEEEEWDEPAPPKPVGKRVIVTPEEAEEFNDPWEW